MSPPAIEANLIRRFRAARAAGLPAAAAYRQARTPELRYESCGDAAVELLFDEPERAGFEVIATATPDEDPDRSWLGEYTSTWSPGVIALAPPAPRHVPRYLLPSYTVAQRRADLSRLGYARGPAQIEAERQVREDARLIDELDARIVTVSVRMAGVLLGEASIGADFGPNADFEEQLVTFASTLVLDEAIADARAALPRVIATLARARQPHIPPVEPPAGATAIVVDGAWWGWLRAEQADSGDAVLHIDPADPQARVRVLMGDTELLARQRDKRPQA